MPTNHPFFLLKRYSGTDIHHMKRMNFYLLFFLFCLSRFRWFHFFNFREWIYRKKKSSKKEFIIQFIIIDAKETNNHSLFIQILFSTLFYSWFLEVFDFNVRLKHFSLKTATIRERHTNIDFVKILKAIFWETLAF